MLDFGRQHDLLTVLLIDDDLVSREVMATVLTMNGYAVHTAANGEASLDVLDGGECVPGVILMDAQMPGLSGTHLIEQLRTRSTATIFVLSASNAPEEMVDAADGFLLKPLTADGVQRLLQTSEAQATLAATPNPSNLLTSTGSGPLSLEASDPRPADPVVSLETLTQLREMMPADAVRQIYAATVADLRRRIVALDTAIASGNAAEVRRIGHAIKGGCGMAGALQAARLGALIESGILESNDNQLDNSSSVIGDLRAAARNLESMLEAGFPA
jgi:CheY-like chemotaxis protein/HPt (histidine-containing phosphotransfer) domain-containing protein